MKQDDRLKHKDNLCLNYLVPVSPEETRIWENDQCHSSQDFHSLVKGSCLFQSKWNSSSFRVRLTCRSKTTFTEDNTGGESEQTIPMLRGGKSPGMTHEPLVMGLIQLPLSQLELHHTLSRSARNSMAITLYQLESQPVCTHMDTIMPFSTDPSSTP